MASTLEQIEGEIWPEPDFHSHLVTTCYALRKKPIDQFSVEDLRIMIGQNFGVSHLFLYALKVLRDNPLAAGDFYEGDLLKSVLSSDFVRTSTNDLVLEELGTLCSIALDKAVEQIDEDISFSFGGMPPSDFGIDEATMAEMRANKLLELEKQQPWRTVFKFMRERGLPVGLAPV